MTNIETSGSQSDSEGEDQQPVQVAGQKRKPADDGGPAPKRRRTDSPETSSSSSAGDSGSDNSSSGSQASQSSDGDSTDTFRPEGVSDEVSDDSSESSQDTTAMEELVRRFIREAVAWAKANEDRIHEAYDSEGGWEVWLEVELYLRLKAAGVAVSRQPHYTAGTTGGARADLVVGDAVLIEMKVETHDESKVAFVGRVAKDKTKVDGGAGKWAVAVVAIAYDDGTALALEKEFTSKGIVAGPLYIFWDATVAS